MQMGAIQTVKQANTTAMVAEASVPPSPPHSLEGGRVLMQTVRQLVLQVPHLFIVGTLGMAPISIGTMTVSGVNSDANNGHT